MERIERKIRFNVLFVPVYREEVAKSNNRISVFGNAFCLYASPPETGGNVNPCDIIIEKQMLQKGRLDHQIIRM